MRFIRGLGRIVGVGLLVALLVPSLVGWTAALLDRGPDGSVRLALFPLALTLLDPFVWTCVRNSLLVASATAALSLAFGVGLGSVLGPSRFRGRTVFEGFLVVPLAAGPLLIAPSFARLPDWLEGQAWLGISGEIAARWSVLVGTGLATGVPLVALAIQRGLGQVEPSWSEAAIAAGATRGQVWRDLIWPNFRPGVARAVALIFTLTLVEPAGPLILGLERTLPVQIIRAATRLDQPTRTAALALLATALALIGRTVIRWWGGPSHSRLDLFDSNRFTGTVNSHARLARLFLGTWSVFTVGPLGFWLGRGFRSARAAHLDQSSSLIAEWLADSETRTWLSNSVMTAGLAVVVDLVILRALISLRPTAQHRLVRLACRIFEAMPPLAFGAWALALPWLILALADGAGGPLAPGLRWVALELSPGRSPGILLIMVLAGCQLPLLAEAAMRTSARIRPSRVHASRLMGASEPQAAQGGEGGRLGAIPWNLVFLSFSMAATTLTPALLLTPYSDRSTVAPALLALIVEPGTGQPHAFALVTLILGLNLIAFALARISNRLGSSVSRT